ADLLRAVRGLATYRYRLDLNWVSSVDPLFARVDVFCLPDVSSVDEFQQEDGSLFVRSVAVAPGVTVTAGEKGLELGRSDCVFDLSAEHDGLVLSVLVHPGQDIRSRTPLFTFLPFQLVQPTVPAAWQSPGSPPLVPREPMLGVINFLELAGHGWDSMEHTLD